MALWIYLRAVPTWTWHCVRAWIEIGRRVHQIETDLRVQSAAREDGDARLRESISEVLEMERSALEKLHRRIDELDDLHTERLTAMDRTMQRRVDQWAQQLSAQMNQLYVAVVQGRVQFMK